MSLAIGAGAFVTGWILSKLAGLSAKRAAAGETPTEHHRIRSLEASLRVAQKKAEEMSEQFESTCVDFNTLKEAHEELEVEISGRETELTNAKQAIRDETSKVHDLRRELTTRAEAKIRAEAHAKDIETELSVMQAGSTAMKDEVDRLAAEHEDLTTRLHEATGSFEHPMDETVEEEDRNQSSEEFLPDC